MIRFAVVGTNWISHSFCQAAHKTGKLKLEAVYSRTLIKAREFGVQYQVSSVYDDLQKIAENPAIDAVYIASPNSLHAPQADLFLRHGKHVIGEKPLASNIDEVEKLIATAKQHNVVLFEAVKTCYLPNLKVCAEALPSLGKLRKAHLSYCQYSSRYQQYLNGDNPNTFNPAFSNGSLMDIGIYPLNFAIELFGPPKTFTASGVLLDSGVDVHGSLTLNYDEFEVVISHSKVSNGFAPSEIQGENGSLLIENISDCDDVTLMKKESKQQISKKILTVPQAINTMQYEAACFAELVEEQQINHKGLEQSLLTSKILTEARKMIGVVYPADHLIV